MSRVYIHETIQITVQHRKQYLDHMTGVWASKSRELYGMRCYGVWATVGSTGPWPEAVVLWEIAERAALSRMLSGEFNFLSDSGAPIKDHFATFWASAPPGVHATSGVDRLLEPTASSLAVADLIAGGAKGAGYYHETIRCRPGAIDDLLAQYEPDWKPLNEEQGLRFLGAWRTLLRNETEAIVLWALPHWNHWEKIGALRGDRRAERFRGCPCNFWRGMGRQAACPRRREPDEHRPPALVAIAKALETRDPAGTRCEGTKWIWAR
jgi:hypothetical protein